ncbi:MULTISPECIES: AglZ/HisF2 family acetamidino modification protein [unclassified Cryobacterium]|uniref:AglZ/HisF2 family acetamidino modification protein n=1 Tax=unclassified Cryobacterium TaxID=2649013 RepID=UPI0014462CB9|nr:MULTISPECIES: AglZ/HisF2 family acetamidino modification protein [unclassified Cryobacterium]
MNSFPRVIPVLLVSDGYLVKPVKFRGGKYIGDPINAVRIFNEKQVDELVVCDIDASVKGTGVNFTLIEEIASEAFMPVAYGGGVTSAEDAKRVVGIGIEKIVLNTAFVMRPESVTEISEDLGSSSTVVSIDSKKKLTGGWDTYVRRGSKRTGLSPSEAARRAQELGAGEILVSSIDRESTFTGYDLPLVESVAAAVSVPVIALGGASGFDDFRAALDKGASAVAAGSMFVLNGKHRAVLISYPAPAQLRSLADRS